MASLGSITNNSLVQIAEYNLFGQLIGAALTPYVMAITNTVNELTPNNPLSPADAALAVVRNELTEDDAAKEAAKSGVNRERFHTLARLTGDAPGPGDLAVALRRGLIDAARYDTGIRQGRLRDEWAELVKELAVIQPSPEAILQAYLEGQIEEAEARSRFTALGGDAGYFDILFHSQGQAPTPLEAAEMARRGFIPWDGSGPEVVSFQQAFLEGPWRNKWLDPYRKASQYLPPPRTITAMYREGSLDHARAAELLGQVGLAPDLVAAYLASGSAQKTQGTKNLAQSTITELYRDRLVNHADALASLVSLGYSTAEGEFILSIEDMRLSQRFLSLAVGRIHTLYVGHKLDRATTVSVLGSLGINGQERDDVLGIWDWERAANIRTLTPAEVAQAYHVKLLAAPDALQQLQELGYTPHDAWLYLSVHEKGPVGEPPPVDSVGLAPGP